MTAKDIAVWVGRQFYTVDSFVKEVRSIGACRRVNNVPDVEVGKSRVFLVTEIDGKNAYFGYYTIGSIGYVVGPGVDIPEELRERGVKPMSVTGASAMPVRGCGQLVFGAIYLLSEEDMEKVKDLADGSDISGSGMVLILPPMGYGGKRFRGFRYVNGGDILAEAEELVGVSAVGGKRFERYLPLDEFLDEPIASKHKGARKADTIRNRNKRIVDKIMAGATRKDVAAEFDLSVSRITEILKSEGLTR